MELATLRSCTQDAMLSVVARWRPCEAILSQRIPGMLAQSMSGVMGGSLGSPGDVTFVNPEDPGNLLSLKKISY